MNSFQNRCKSVDGSSGKNVLFLTVLPESLSVVPLNVPLTSLVMETCYEF
jgi:hypothetical protein